MTLRKREQPKPEVWEDRHRKMMADGCVLVEDAHYVLVADDDEEQRKHGAIRETVDAYYKRTPLIVACIRGDCEQVQQVQQVRSLLQQGADPTIPDRRHT